MSEPGTGSASESGAWHGVRSRGPESGSGVWSLVLQPGAETNASLVMVEEKTFSKIYILYQILTFDILCLLTYVDEFLRNDLVCAKFAL